MNDLTGIFEIEHADGYCWCDCRDLCKSEIKEAKYFVNKNDMIGHHEMVMSPEENDMTGYVDEIQNDDKKLPDNKLYVVTYFDFDDGLLGFLQNVDFGITKEQIIENVKSNKYVGGAYYYTMEYVTYITKSKRVKGTTVDAKTYEELVNREQAINRVCATCHDINGEKFCDFKCPFIKAQVDLAKEWDAQHGRYKLESVIEHVCAQHDECDDCLFYSDCPYAHGKVDNLEPAFEAIRKLVIR